MADNDEVREPENGEGGPDGGSGGEGAKKGNVLSSPIAKVGLLVLLLGVNAIVSFMVVQKVIKPKVAVVQTEPAEEKVDIPEPGELFLIENLIVNPSGTRATRYLRLAAALEYDASQSEMAVELEKRQFQFRDLLITELSSRTLDELVDPRVKEEIREELLARLNGSIRSGRFENLYFTEYVIQ